VVLYWDMMVCEVCFVPRPNGSECLIAPKATLYTILGTTSTMFDEDFALERIKFNATDDGDSGHKKPPTRI
jgi:hypothetical protein